MGRCPSCGQTGSIDAIALAGGAWEGLRCQRCEACRLVLMDERSYDDP